jgi:hypothetical protein
VAPTALPSAIDQAARSPAPRPAPAKANANNDMAIELGGGAVALLVLGGAALAFSRRRRHEEEEWHDEQAMEAVAEEPASAVEPAPVVEPRHERIAESQPAIVAPAASAFAWGPADSNQADDDGSDRRPGESWVERARRGPSPANPSVSLKNRLRRAAFFDKRERDVAAGKAEPVDVDAGLPDAMVEEREFA